MVTDLQPVAAVVDAGPSSLGGSKFDDMRRLKPEVKKDAPPSR